VKPSIAKCGEWQPFMPKELAHACELPKGHDGKHQNTFEDPPGYWWRATWLAEHPQGEGER
jgi:hypothetical protein